LKYERAEKFYLGGSEWGESFVQKLIADDPSILGLGELYLRDKERIQPSRGRLDLLLQDEDKGAWFEVEVQLGATNPEHIVRTIEYWDVERRRYPDLRHTAVIIAEEINSRFFNVISLFNQSIPLIALQMTALRIGDIATLTFTKVLDHVPRGIEEESESVASSDRSYWEKRSSQGALENVEILLRQARLLDKSISLRYNRAYISTLVQGQTSNFATFRPQKNAIRISIHLPQASVIDEGLDSRGISWSVVQGTYPYYTVRLLTSTFAEHSDYIAELIKQAYVQAEDYKEQGAE